MSEIPDETALLRAFQADPGPEAFQRLADRHLPLVWSVARRMLADEPVLVEDAVQLPLTYLEVRSHLRGAVCMGDEGRHKVWAALRPMRRSHQGGARPPGAPAVRTTPGPRRPPFRVVFPCREGLSKPS
jgi:hypothetical protein